MSDPRLLWQFDVLHDPAGQPVVRLDFVLGDQRTMFTLQLDAAQAISKGLAETVARAAKTPALETR